MCGLCANLLTIVDENCIEVKFLFADGADNGKKVIAGRSVTKGFDIRGMGFGPIVDKEMAIALVFDDLSEFFADLFAHCMEYLRFFGFLPEEVKDLNESFYKLFEQFDLMLIGGFTIMIPEKNVLLKIVALIINRV